MVTDRDLHLREFDQEEDFYHCPHCEGITHPEDLIQKDYFDEVLTSHYTIALCPHCKRECEDLDWDE